MQKTIVITVMLIALFAHTAAFGAGWSQRPDLEKHALQSQWDSSDYQPRIVRADDWLCVGGQAINKISWWGLEERDISVPIIGFNIKVFGNDAINSLPNNTVIYNEYFDISRLAITTEGNNIVGDTVYEYDLDLNVSEWISQTAGETQWLSIIAVTEDVDTFQEWRWQEALTNNLSDTVVGILVDSGDAFKPDVNYSSWGSEMNDHDLSFEFGEVPEPGTMAMMSGGFIGLLYLVRRRKK